MFKTINEFDLTEHLTDQPVITEVDTFGDTWRHKETQITEEVTLFLYDSGQAALVIRLFYEIERQKANARQSTSTGGSKPQLIPTLDEAENGNTTNEALAKKAGIGKSEGRQGIRTDLLPGLVGSKKAEKRKRDTQFGSTERIPTSSRRSNLRNRAEVEAR